MRTRIRANHTRLFAGACCAAMVLIIGTEPSLGQTPKQATRQARQQAQANKTQPKQQPKKTPANAQTKRIGQEQLALILAGKPEKAVESCQSYLEQEPNHLESMYNLVVAWCQLKDTRQAVAWMQRALAGGLPPGRFIAGPRDLLEPLTETPEFRQLLADVDGRPIHGPLLGCMTDRGAKFWIRTAEEVPVQVLVGTSRETLGNAAGVIKSATVFTEAGRDYTTVAEVQRLEPDTVYYYDVLLRGRSTLGPEFPAFRTFPPVSSAARFQVGFGGGAGFTEKHERMWDTIASHRPTAFLFLGDNVYIDNPTRPDMQLYTYYRRQSRPEYRRLIASTPIFAVWDDHDFGVDDCFYGAEIERPPWKRDVWHVFQNNWNNPSYGGGEKNPGCWFRFSIGNVEFFMLDGRYYRSNPRDENPSMLGAVQKKWLLEALENSDAVFKVIASPVPWVVDAKGDSLDTWRGYQTERDEIFSFLGEKQIDGVMLISADRHRSDVWRIDREGSYPLWEFESSRLTNIHTHPPVPGALFSYNKKCSCGLLTFDTTKADPEVTYEIVNIDNELIHSTTIRKSEISFQ